MLLHHFLEFIVVQKSSRDGDTEDEPRLAIVQVTGDGVFGKQATQKGAKGGNAGSGGDQDQILVLVVFRQQHALANGSSHLDLVTGRNVAEVVTADTLLGRVDDSCDRVHVFGTSNTKRHRVAIQQLAVSCRGDTVQTRLLSLALFIQTGWNNGNGLTFHVMKALRQLQQNVLNVTRRFLGDERNASQDSGFGRRRGLGKGVARDIFQKVLRHIQVLRDFHIFNLGDRQVFVGNTTGNAFLARIQLASDHGIKDRVVTGRHHWNASTGRFDMVNIKGSRFQRYGSLFLCHAQARKGFHIAREKRAR
mmetsp:Transcript_27628/g.57818  ORF Transcript_27628/g.57818 Transcript_27628/m.57818 type:complete len:306 (+) Transcript_27628:366-1283(+)